MCMCAIENVYTSYTFTFRDVARIFSSVIASSNQANKNGEEFYSKKTAVLFVCALFFLLFVRYVYNMHLWV